MLGHCLLQTIFFVQLILASNGFSGVLTAVIRPNAIYGPRDAVELSTRQCFHLLHSLDHGVGQLLGRVAASGSQGIGSKGSKQDYIYVENLVHAFLKLEEKLVPGSSVAGKVSLPLACRQHAVIEF